MNSSVPQHGRTRLGDTFNEDVSELNYLKSKPTCFVIFGKPGCGKTALAKKLAATWRCEFIHGTDIILREIDLGSEIGKKMQEVLMRGEALTTEFVVQLLKEKASSPEVSHYGYILDGLPCLSDQSNSVQQQIDIIKNWQLKPDFIINIKIPDVDLNSRRVGMRVDSQTGDEYPRHMWDPPVKVETQNSTNSEENEEEEVEEEAEEEEEPQPDNMIQELSKDTKERLVHAPENQQMEVEKSSTTYKEVTLKLLEAYMADHDRQYLIELDGNFPLNVVFQQLMAKLDTFTARRAIAPIRLQNLEEEELPDEIETEELLRTLASYQMPGARYRWRRSKWGRLCPVSLRDGNMVQGKSDLAVSFLDKMYVLSSVEAMTLFLKNPRPYLLPPMPTPPCKVAVLGAPMSGKTTACKLLAEKYKAKVLVLEDLMKVKFQTAKTETVEKARMEAIESAIHVVQNKLEQEAIERSEKRRREAELAKEVKEEAAKGETEGADETTESTPPSVVPTDEVMTTDESVQDSVDRQDAMSPVPTVTEEHEEVQQIVAEAVRQAEMQEIKLPPEAYVATLKEALEKLSEERRAIDPDAPKDGGWILDAFPENKEQWAAMVENGIIPDEFVCLADKTQNVEHIRERYFKMNEDEITTQYRSRLLGEKQASLKAALEEEAAKKAAALEAISEQTDEASDELDKDTSSKSDITASSPQGESADLQDERSLDASKPRSAILLDEINELEKSYIGMPVQEAPEFNKFRDICRAFEREWAPLYSTITATVTNKPIYVDIQDKSADEITQMTVSQIEKSFGYRSWDFSGQDLDEEEEDANAEEGEEGEEEEDEEAMRHKKKNYGFTKHFDPVALKEDYVLWPGNPDIAAKFREKVYHFKSTESREKFVENPTFYLPEHEPLKPPPPRILVLGARGAGKTLQGRMLAKELGIFHISFRERLQEMILLKTGKKMGPEHEDQKLLDKELSVSVDEAVRKAIEVSAESGATEEAEEEEEEEKFDLTDEEEAIRANLVDDESLPVEILANILPGWWKEEPYRSTGFILEGFPRTVDEAQFLIQSGLFPDAALMLMVDDTDVIKRLLPPRMDLWKQRRNMQDEKKNRIKKKKKDIRNEKMEARRAELLHEQKEKKLELAAQGEDEDEDDDEEEDIDEILQMEFEEEEEEEEEEEQEEDANDRMKGEIGENFDEDVSRLQAVQEQFEDGSIPRLEVQASRKPAIVKYLVDIKLKPFIAFRESLFERVVPVSLDVATKMLMSGYKQPSSFTKWDPVKLLDDGDVIQPMQGVANPTYPVVHNHYIYFLSSLDSRNKFMANPMRYVFNQPLAKPVVPIQMAIVGPPKSGKTTLSERFSKKFGCVRISAGNSIRRVLDQQMDSVLSKQIQSHLHQGGVVPDALVVEAIATAMLDTTTTTRGYVLDGYPCTEQQRACMSKRGILPVKFIELRIDGKEVLVRAEKDRAVGMWDLPRHDSEGIMIVKHACYKEHSPSIEAFYTEEHQSWHPYDASISKWKLWELVLAEAVSSVKQIQDYLDRIARGEAARLSDLCISPSEFELHLGVYGHYCPVSLNFRGELVDCSDKSYLRYAVEFRSKYYKLASLEDMKTFMENPELFVPPLASRSLPPPHGLPQRRTRDEVKAMFPKQIEMNGYCPVTYLDGKLGFECLVEGSSELVAEYKEKLYSFQSEEKLQKFMKLPERYHDLKLPSKLPPKKEPMDISGLPMLGYLEQGAAISIIRSLTAAGCFKPKFPFTTIQRSALIYIACHLKAFNPRNSAYIRDKYKKRLCDFEDQCRIITYLGDHMTKRYRDPSTRPFDFDHKMEIFLGLEHRKPHRNWVK